MLIVVAVFTVDEDRFVNFIVVTTDTNMSRFSSLLLPLILKTVPATSDHVGTIIHVIFCISLNAVVGVFSTLFLCVKNRRSSVPVSVSWC